ncbi:MAG: holo-ACP synthase [Bacteroidetes bacterium]|nr:holo-ACP synthase [Bacteroidota bacterium]
MRSSSQYRADHGQRFLTRIFTAAELDYCLDCKTPGVRLSGRFAAKEAIMKMLGTGWRGGIAWTDMEILPDGMGKPHVRLSGRCAAEAEKLGISEVLISISHCRTYAMATAIATSNE